MRKRAVHGTMCSSDPSNCIPGTRDGREGADEAMTAAEGSVRRGGLAAAAGGVLTAASALMLDPGVGFRDSSPLHYPSVFVAHLGSLLLLGGLLALRDRHARRSNESPESPESASSGLPGFRLAFYGYLIGAALAIAGVIAEALVGRPAPLVAVLFGFLASLAYLAGELGLLLLGLAVVRAGVLPLPWRALPLAIFLLGVPLAVLALLVFREGMMLRQEPDAGVLAFLVWDLPEMLIALAWSLLGWGLFSGMGGDAQDAAAGAAA